MTSTSIQTQALAEFPAALQQLIKAELDAGNSIVAIESGFPAPPVGSCVKLAKKVSTRARASSAGLSFYERNNSSYSGEFTDAQRFFFVLEPPNEPEPPPDMDAIREELAARERAANADRFRLDVLEWNERQASKARASSNQESNLLRRFRESMVMNHERWHDGTGYDLDLLQSATPEERAEIENLLLARGVQDWRDVSALAVLNTQRARELLRRSFARVSTDLQVSLISHAPELFSEEERTAVLVRMITSDREDGLTQAMLLVEEFHPPPVVKALVTALRTRDPVNANEIAMMLLVIHGRAESLYDFEANRSLPRFEGDDRSAQVRAFCERIGRPDLAE